MNQKMYIWSVFFLPVVLLITSAVGNPLDTAFLTQEQPAYKFLTQTSTNLSCDPYTNGLDSNLILECSVLGPRMQAEAVKIVWFRNLNNGSATQNLNDLSANQTGMVEVEKHLVIPGCTESYTILRSTLTVINVGRTDISGQYWCALQEPQQQSVGVILINENVPRLLLKGTNAYQNLNGCPENVIHASLGSSMLASSNPSLISTSSSSSSSSFSTSVTTSSSPSVFVKKPRSKRLPSTTDESVLNLSVGLTIFDFKGIIIVSVLLGALFCAVSVLLSAVICMCCKRRSRAAKRRKNESFQSTISLVSSRDTLMVPHQISPTMSSPLPQMTPALASTPTGSQSILSSPPRHPPPRMKKLPLLPLHSTMPLRLSHQISSPGFQDELECTNIDSRRVNRAATEQPSLNNLTGQLLIPLNYFAGTTGIEAQDFLRQDSSAKDDQDMGDNIYAAPFSDCASIITQSNSAIGSNSRLNAIVNTSLPTYADLDMDAIFNDDEEERKYKSLNKYTMDDHPVYEDPSQACIDAEDDDDERRGFDNTTYTQCHPKHQTLNSAMRYAKHLAAKERILGAEVRESVDGEYVMPNEVLRHAADSSTSDESDEEQPDYIVVS